jgi:hypothetical protein
MGKREGNEERNGKNEAQEKEIYREEEKIEGQNKQGRKEVWKGGGRREGRK